MQHIPVSDEFAALWRDIADDPVTKHNTTWIWPDYEARKVITVIQTQAQQMLEALRALEK
ncbi:hypothetical protein P0D75_34475 [Paraburkholderia sediminicola]|uniref:hypothetical protein n=1 Tax=Paraburkholderia sediminicola TaxID=458836 RepID=UPI000EB0A5B2